MAGAARARRYAQAAFQLAIERQDLERWRRDLGTVAALGRDQTVVQILESPRFAFKDKVNLLSGRLADMHPLVVNLLLMLIQKGRLALLPDIYADFEELADEYRGVASAEVTTAVELDEAERKRLAERLSEVVGKQVVVRAKVDPAVVGGIIARFGDKLLDASTRHRLEALKKQIAGATR